MIELQAATVEARKHLAAAGVSSACWGVQFFYGRSTPWERTPASSRYAPVAFIRMRGCAGRAGRLYFIRRGRQPIADKGRVAARLLVARPETKARPFVACAADRARDPGINRAGIGHYFEAFRERNSAS